jgi:hypothetical protein
MGLLVRGRRIAFPLFFDGVRSAALSTVVPDAKLRLAATSTLIPLVAKHPAAPPALADQLARNPAEIELDG